MNSLRSLLIGLYDIKNIEDIDKNIFPKIISYPTLKDPLIDGVTTDLELKNKHRKDLFHTHSLPHGYKDFKVIDKKLKACLGYPDRVNYHVIREQLICMKSHDIPYPVGIVEQDIQDQVRYEK